MNKRNFFSWLTLGVTIWIIIGIILYPYWYYELIFNGKFRDLEFWFGGIQCIFTFLFLQNPILLIALVILYFLRQKKVIEIKIPELDFFSSFKKASVIIILSVLAAVFIWTIPFNNQVKDSKILNISNTVKSTNQNKITTPLDFIYINKDRVDNLFDQIKPELILKEKQLESQSEEGKEISNGENPLLNSKRSERNQSRQTDTYSASEISEPKKVTSLLNHFYALNAIKEFQTLELSAEDVKKLEEFKTISQQFQISYDKTKFVQVYDRVMGESLIKEHSNMKDLTGQVVIMGDFLVSVNTDKILLRHNYIEIEENNRITFNVTPLSKSEKSLSALYDDGQNNKSRNLNIFGKITRVESSNKVTDIYFDAYAIW